jgi:hypothetical protein
MAKTMVSLSKVAKGDRADLIHESIDNVMEAHNKQDTDVITCKKGACLIMPRGVIISFLFFYQLVFVQLLFS